MELRQMRYFVATAGAGSLSRAALSLDMTQSGLSRQIAAMEQQLGIRLFDRTGHGVALTHAGEMLLPRARDMLARADEVASAMADYREGPAGDVTLAVTATVAQSITAPVLAAAAGRYPGIRVQVMESSGSLISEWLADGRADLAVSYAPPEQFKGALDGEKLRADRLAVIGPAPDASPLPFAALGDLPLILPSQRSGLRRRMEDMARQHGVALVAAMEVDSLAATLAAVELGLGHTLLPAGALVAEAALRNLVARPIVDPIIACWLSLYVGRARGSAPPVKALIKTIRDHAAALPLEPMAPGLAPGLA